MLDINSSQWRTLRNFLLLFLISVGVKLYASQLLGWEVDYVPVVARGQVWLDGGAFPSVGTLSSVAAYNMPFLVWMQLPVMLFTRDVATILIVTQLLFNFVATWFVYWLGRDMFSPMVGLIGATLFTFSETGISSAYTAWAQLLLPGFYVMVVYCLYRWKTDGNTHYVALAWILSTAAFMTHFSAVLLYGMILVFWVILRLPINLKGLAIGFIVSSLMLAPYLVFEVERDFVDLKAFFTRQTTIDKTTLDEYAYLKPENQGRASQLTTPSPPSTESTPSVDSPPYQPSRLERGIAWVLSIPIQIIGGLRLVFTTDLQSLRQHFPLFHWINGILRALLEVSFWGGIVFALVRYVTTLRASNNNLPEHDRNLRHRLNLTVNTLIDTPAGRNLILLLFVLGIIIGLIIVRAAPDQQATYYTAIVSLQFVMCAYGIYSFMEHRHYGLRILILVMLFAGLGAFDRIVRVATHNVYDYSPFNVALYQSIHRATAWIADDWGDATGITVSYDVMPEMANQWWIAPWHTIDESYRFGMAYDYLLDSYYGLENQNANPVGLADQPDYIITYKTGLDRYDLSQHQVLQFGAIYVLK
jgi:hypothetical protein